ncbi:hypothetical protein OHV05_37565 (plasmid) [Kitasatospora sp. NBC_00070]|uniref:hypothetical protein n=1 Tax=Kitasatospora sp. NBC_00070 TaxID=2975962 RepID=UPI002F91A0FE
MDIEAPAPTPAGHRAAQPLLRPGQHHCPDTSMRENPPPPARLRLSRADHGHAPAQQGGTVVILAGALPIEQEANRETVGRYLMDGLLPRQLWLGKTRLSGRWTIAQLAGEACIRCGASTGPLHRDGTIPVPAGQGVVRDTPVVRCTPCLAVKP